MADGIVVNPGDVLPDTSVNALYFSLKEFDLTIPVDAAKLDQDILNVVDNCFIGARLHVERLIFTQSPSVSFELLNLENDPTCFGSFGSFVETVPSDNVVSLSVDDLNIKLLESVPGQIEIKGLI